MGYFEKLPNNEEKQISLLSVISLEDMEHLLEWNISKNHTERWGCIKGKYSRTYSFMHEDRNEVIKWLAKNYRL